MLDHTSGYASANNAGQCATGIKQICLLIRLDANTGGFAHGLYVFTYFLDSSCQSVKSRILLAGDSLLTCMHALALLKAILISLWLLTYERKEKRVSFEMSLRSQDEFHLTPARFSICRASISCWYFSGLASQSLLSDIKCSARSLLSWTISSQIGAAKISPSSSQPVPSRFLAS